MFSTKTFVAFLVLATPFLVRADVVPVAPAPLDVFNEGSTCTTSWTGDTVSNTIWKNMAIELMTGSNEEMEFITNVATGQDGTTSGTFSYPCPNVTPNSPIYFYQFAAPLAKNLTWTGRFTIASSTGGTTPATNSTTEADGTIIYWGNGALVDPSTAKAPPPFAASISMSSSSSSTIAPNSSTSAIVSTSTAASSSGNVGATIDVTSSNSSPEPSSTSASSSALPTSGAMTTTTFDIRVLAIATLVLSFVW